jgi:hypothetical protein
MTAYELLRETGADRKNLSRQLNRLVGEKVLVFEPSGDATPGRGHERGHYRLASDAKRRVEEVVSMDISRGQLRRGQSFIAVRVPAVRDADLMTILRDSAAAGALDWTARLDGEERGYLMVFGDNAGEQPPANLIASIAASDLPASAGVVGAVFSTDGLDRHAAGVVRAKVRAGRRRSQSQP